MKRLEYIFHVPCGPDSQETLLALSDKKNISSEDVKARIEELKFPFEKIKFLNKALRTKVFQGVSSESLPKSFDSYREIDKLCLETNGKIKEHLALIANELQPMSWSKHDDLPVGRMLATFFDEPIFDESNQDLVIDNDVVAFRVSHLLTVLGDVPYYFKDKSKEMRLLSPDRFEYFLSILSLKKSQSYKMVSLELWRKMVKKNPGLCQDRFWLKEGDRYFLSPKCGSLEPAQRPGWISMLGVRFIALRELQ